MQWRTIFAAIQAVILFVLVTQSDVVLPPLVKVILGAVSVALTVLNPSGIAKSPPEP